MGGMVCASLFIYTLSCFENIRMSYVWVTRGAAANVKSFNPPGQDYFGIRRGLLMLFYSKKYLTITPDLL